MDFLILAEWLTEYHIPGRSRSCGQVTSFPAAREQSWLGSSSSALHGDRGTGISFAQPEYLDINKGIRFHFIKSRNSYTERVMHQ